MVDRAPSDFECVVTTRSYSEVNRLLSRVKLENIQFGRHGGGDLFQKLEASVERQNELIPFVAKAGFDLSLSFISPEAARVSFGLGLAHVICSDSPHAVAPARLAVPLCRELLTPFPIDKSRWTQYGLTPGQISKYNALDPWAWLGVEKVRASSKIFGRVMIRLEETFASYFKQGKGVSSALSRLVEEIKKAGVYEILLVPRYDDQREWARREFGQRCVIPDSAINGPEEISECDLLIGGGATMTQEAALLGVPNISYFPSANLDVFTNYYFPKKLSVQASTPGELISNTVAILSNIESEKRGFIERAETETSRFEDPVRFTFDHLSGLLESKG
jgi:predicted glycosyltransferase